MFELAYRAVRGCVLSGGKGIGGDGESRRRTSRAGGQAEGIARCWELRYVPTRGSTRLSGMNGNVRSLAGRPHDGAVSASIGEAVRTPRIQPLSADRSMLSVLAATK